MSTSEQPIAQLASLDDEWEIHPTTVEELDLPPAPARAWFLGEGPLPRQEPTDPAGLETMRREAADLPLLAELRRALDLIGDGLPVKSNGAPYVRDVRTFERRQDARPSWDCVSCSPTLTELVDLLGALGCVEVEDRRLRRSHGSSAEDAFDPGAEGHLDAVRSVILEGVRGSQREPWWFMGTVQEHILRDALLIATSDEGLQLPWAPSATGFHHCRDHSWFLVGLLGHPRIRDIPLDVETGHVPASALAELAACRERMRALVQWGLLTCDDEDEQHHDVGDLHVRAPLLMRGALAGWR